MSETGQATKRVGKDAPFPMYVGLGYNHMKFETLYQGAEGPKSPVHAVIQSGRQLAGTLANAAQLGITAGSINFETEELIIVGLGARPTTGYKVDIWDVAYLTDRNEGPEAGKNLPNLTIVDYTEFKPTGISGDMITYPLHIIKTEKLTGAVQFSQSSPDPVA
jgi:hypothetical protein